MNDWFDVFNPVVTIGILISIAIAILSFIGNQILRQFKDELNPPPVVKQPKPEPAEKVKGLPSHWAILLNRLLDKVLGERRDDEKRKNDDALFSDEAIDEWGREDGRWK